MGVYNTNMGEKLMPDSPMEFWRILAAVLLTAVISFTMADHGTVSEQQMAYEFTQVRSAINDLSTSLGSRVTINNERLNDIDSRLSRIEGQLDRQD